MHRETPAVILNPHQRRHFEVLFARLEDSLAMVQALLRPAPAREPVLAIVDDDVPHDFLIHAEPILAALRDQISHLARELELHPRRASRSRTISATLSTEAIRVEESRSSKLRGYGHVDESVARRLDPVLEEIARTLNHLAATVRPRGRPARGG